MLLLDLGRAVGRDLLICRCDNRRRAGVFTAKIILQPSLNELDERSLAILRADQGSARLTLQRQYSTHDGRVADDIVEELASTRADRDVALGIDDGAQSRLTLLAQLGPLNSILAL